MNREDIIKLAKECGHWSGQTVEMNDVGLERFAALVAAAEREKVAQWMIAQGYSTGHGDTLENLLAEIEWQIEDRIKNIIRTKTTYAMQNDLAESVEPDEESDK